MKRIFLACTLGLVHAAYGATTGTWNITTSGTWDLNGNWTPGPFPNGIGDTANFLDKITANSTITSGIGITVGNITFDNSNNYLVSLSGNTLTMNNGGTATITVTNGNGSGSHEISAPISLANDLLFTHSSTADFTISGAISESGIRILQKTGIGTGALILSGVNSYSKTTISQGILQISSDSNLGLGTASVDFGIGTLRTPVSVTLLATRSINAGSTATFEVTPVATTTTIDSNISGGGGIAKTGAGTLVLTDPLNTYHGTAINAGVLQISSNGNLGNAAGPITFDGGTFHATASFTMPLRDIPITSAAIFDIDPSVTITAGGVVSGGSGTLTKVGAGTLALTNAANSYGGGTFINAGTLEISNNGNLGAASGGITFNGTTLRTTGVAGVTIPATRAISITSSATFDTMGPGPTTVDSNISGAVSLIKTGIALLTLTDETNSYSGGTFINAGILDISKNGQLGAASGGITFDGGTFQATPLIPPFVLTIPAARAISITSAATFKTVNTLKIDGVISGVGGTLSLEGTGTFVLTGVNTYSGGTAIILPGGGILMLSGAGALAPTGAVNLNNGLLAIFDISGITPATGTTIGDLSSTFAGSSVVLGSKALTFGAAGSVTFAGVISGVGGSIIKQGSGAVTFSNANTYTGGTTINNGTLSLSGAGILAAAGAVSVNSSSSIFSISAITPATSATIGDLSGVTSSSVVLGTKALNFGDTGTATFAGVISDSGGGSVLKQGSGTAIFSGVNTYTGGTTINNGTLEISSNGNLGGVAGSITFGGGTLRTTASFSIARAIPITSAATFEPTPGATTTTLTGVISGGGGTLTKIGAGTLVLTNPLNTYGGGTFINVGVLEISSDGNLGVAGSITFDGGTLRTTASFSIARAIPITSAATFEPTPGATTTTVDGAITGAGSLTKIGAGTLVLTNAGNTYGGGTTINNGTLSLSGAGVLASTGTVNVNSASSVFNISGVTAGATIGDFIGVSGSSVLLGIKTLTFGDTGTATFAGSISDTAGGGSIVKQGSGIAIFSGFSTYGSGTTINAGTLSLSGTGSLLPTGAVSVNGATSIFDISATTAGTTIGDLSGVPSSMVALGNKALTFGTGTPTTFGGNITGAGGSIIKQGSGTVNFSDVSTYTGGTTINDGTLSLSGSGALAPTGSVTVNSATASFDITATAAGATIGDLSGVAGSFVALGVKSLTFGAATSTTFAGSISGSVSLIKQGSGIFTVSGVNAFTGTFDVNAGKLNLASGLFPPASTTNIAAGASLTGNGTLGAVNLNGTASPGNSIGTINVGNIAFNGSSNFIVELSNTASDQIISSGVVTINPGATLTLVGSGLITPTASYLVIDSSAPLVRNADFTLVNPFTRFNFIIQYTPQDVLVLLESTIPFSGTGNAAGPARCFNNLLNNLAPDLIPVLDVLNVQTVAQWQNSFNQMQPSNFDDLAYAQENVAERIRQSFSAHLFEQRVESCPDQLNSWRLWFAPFVEHVHQHGKKEHSGYKENFRGFTAAADYQFKKHWTLTTGFSYADSDVGVVGGRTSGDFKTYAGSVGAIWAAPHFFADGLLSYLFSSASGKRKMHFTGPNVDPVSRKAHHNQDTNQVMGHLGGGFNFKLYTGDRGTLNFYPFVNVDYLFVMQHGYKESGAQSLNLHVSRKNYDLVRPEGGLGFGYAGCFEKVRVNADLSVSFIREQRYLGKKTKAHFQDSSCTFKVKGLSPNNNLIAPTAKITLSNTKVTPFSLSIGYHGEFGSNFIENAGEAELKIAF